MMVCGIYIGGRNLVSLGGWPGWSESASDPPERDTWSLMRSAWDHPTRVFLRGLADSTPGTRLLTSNIWTKLDAQGDRMPEYEIRYRDSISGEEKCDRLSAYDAEEAIAQFKLSHLTHHSLQVIDVLSGKILFRTPTQTSKPIAPVSTKSDKSPVRPQENSGWSFFHMTSWCLTALGLISLLLTMSLRGSRVGAECNDGWNSPATGQGACSHHDGVDFWKYENQTAAGLVCPSMVLLIVGGICLWRVYATE